MNSKVLEKFENNVWYFEDYDMANDRINKASAVKSICFNTVLVDRKKAQYVELKNTHNITLLKRFVGHTISNTNISASTISGRTTGLKILIYYMGNVNIEKMTRDSILGYYSYLKTRKLANSTFNCRVSDTSDFLNFLQREGLISKNHVYRSLDRIKSNRKHVNKSISDTILNQIFAILDKVPIDFALLFLIVYSTGMRISEACLLEKGKTKELDDGFFVEFHSVKMKKEATNPIPENLYNLIVQYEKSLDVNETYLFTRKFNKPMHSSTFTNKFNKYIKPFNIKDENNKPYKYRPHDYRHALATQMSKNNIPPTVIQAILHHESESMTYAYIDYTSKDRIKAFKKFVNYKGIVLNTNTNTAKAEWLRENINAQVLPNGLCSLPTKLGKCPHIHSCLNCEDFYTSIEFLDVHKKQIARTKELILIADKNNWKHQMNTNKKNLNRLIELVEILESE